MDNEPRRRSGEDWPSTSDPHDRLRPWEDVALPERTLDIEYIIGIGAVAFILVLGMMAFGVSPWDSPGVRFVARAPVTVPEWLVSVTGPTPRSYWHDTLYAQQTWCTVQEARSISVQGVKERVASLVNTTDNDTFICVKYWQTPYTLDIATERKTPVTVDGVQGWTWRMSTEDFAFQSGKTATLLDNDPAVLRPALAEKFASPRDAYRRAGMYYKLHEERGRRSVLHGPAIMLQWNKGGQHFVLIGQHRWPVTEDLLLEMADSLVRAGQLAPTARTGQ